MANMNRSLTPSRIMLLAGSSMPSTSRTGVAVKRYRLARARLDGRPTRLDGRPARGRGQSPASEPARDSRSASLSME
jgi:hypothetical protein